MVNIGINLLKIIFKIFVFFDIIRYLYKNVAQRL